MRRRSSLRKAIKIQVIKQQPALMKIDEGERWTGYLLLIHIQSTGEPFHENSLACAQWSVEQNCLTTGKSFTDAEA